jgi:ABC-2 type transport system permease protein
VNFYPAKFILEKDNITAFDNFYAFSSLGVGIIVFLIIYTFWSIGIRNYKSSGN